jgi:polygalacturonase
MRNICAPLGSLLVVAILLVLSGCERAVGAEKVGWDAVPDILARIVAPEFADRDFAIIKYGAVEGGKADCLPAVVRAIDECTTAGGGRVVVPPGKWLVNGPIHLKSNVNLHLQSGATILFSAEPDHYLPVVFTRFEGTELMNYSPLIYAMEQENIAVTGEGTLDGQAAGGKWWNWKQSTRNNINKLLQMGESGVPVKDRVFGKGSGVRPNFIQPYRCKNVLIEGVTIVNSPMWEINPVLCQNVIVRGVTVNSHGPNNDGCDPESCRDVLIEKCVFDTGDDCIAIKSGRNADGRRVGVPSENLIIRDCTMKDGHGGVVLGSEMSGGIRNVYVENCYMDSPNLDRAIRLKSNSNRGGYLENMYVRNVRIGQVGEAVVRIDLRYSWPEQGDHNPVVRNIFIENVTSEKSQRTLFLVGLKEQPIENVTIRNCTFSNPAEPSIIEYVNKLVLENYTQPEEEREEE